MIAPYLDAFPQFDESVFIAPNATVIGDVTLGREASVWYGAVIRGDVHWIHLGDRTNVQDGAIIHVTNGTAPTWIGDDVTVGHGAIIHGCTVRGRALIGMGAVLLDHCDIGEDCLIGARALVTGRTKIPPRHLVVGSPARAVRTLTDEEVEMVRANAANYVRYSRIAMGLERPPENPFYDKHSRHAPRRPAEAGE